MACSTRSLYGPGFSLNFHFSPSQRMLQDCLMAVTCHGFHISIRSCTSFRSHGCRNWTFRRPCRFCKMMWLLVSVQISSLNKQIVLIGCIVYIDTQVIFMAIFSVPVAVPVPQQKQCSSNSRNVIVKQSMINAPHIKLSMGSDCQVCHLWLFSNTVRLTCAVAPAFMVHFQYCCLSIYKIHIIIEMLCIDNIDFLDD